MISIVGAETYKQYDEINIRHSVRLNDAPTSTAQCNITIYNPDWDVLASYCEMTNDANSNTFNYTLNDTTELGVYNYDITCTDSDLNITESYNFEITATGKEFTTPQSIMYVLLLLLLVAIFVFSLYFAITIRWQNERNNLNELMQINYRKYLKLFSITICYIMLLWGTFIGWSLSTGFIHFNFLGGFFRVLFVIMTALTFPVIASIIILGLISWIRDRKLSDYIDRGIYSE